MAGNVASENELKLLEIIKEKDERIEQLEKALNAKEKKWRQFGVDAEPMHVDAETSAENERKIMKGKSNEVQVNQAENAVDSEISTVPVETVVIAPEILLEILKSMKSRDLLKNGRLVSREWRDFSTEILLKRKNLRVEFRSCKSSGEFIVGEMPSSPQKLEELTAFLSTSKSFPCAHFIFNGNVKSDNAQAFLSQFGSRVKGLKLIGPQNLSSIRNLLVEQIPHLESLELSHFVPEGTSVSRSAINLDMFVGFHQYPGVFVTPAALPAPPPAPVPAPQMLIRIFPADSPAPAPQFPFLVSLKLGEGNSASLVQEILDAAPNLQECFGIRTNEEIETLRSRIHVVKGLKIKHTRPLGTINLNALDVAMPILRQLHLTTLELDLSRTVVLADPERAHAFRTNISNILNSSQGSLRKVKLTPFSNCDSLIEWPQLENVGKLTLSGDLKTDVPRLFAPVENEAGVSRIFPNLHKIHLKEVPWIQHGQISIFRNHPQVSTVKSLKISQPKAHDLEVFVPLFPNVNNLSLAQVQNFTNFAPTIWQMQGLKSLEMEFNCEGSEIDAGFTGMEKTTCMFLRTTEEGEYEVGQVEKFRKRPSILEAKELEQLFLARGFFQSEDYNANPNLHEQQELFIATHFSFKYAFNLMPNLRVFAHRDE